VSGAIRVEPEGLYCSAFPRTTYVPMTVVTQSLSALFSLSTCKRLHKAQSFSLKSPMLWLHIWLLDCTFT
jgi:hypothetical protein